MEKLCGQIPATFDIEDIHDLRVEYKKLRAFIRLLQEEDDNSKLKIPGKVKAVYTSAGPVRDLQLFFPLVEPHFSQLSSRQYLERLNKKLEVGKNDLQQAIKYTSFEKTEEALLSQLPKNLHTKTVRKFALDKIAAIQTGLHSIHHDEDLHTIRKELKDLIYNIKMYRNDFNQPFPVNLGNTEEDLNHAATLLGNYNDLCFALMFLQTHKEEGLPSEETQLLEQLENDWTIEKETRQVEVIQKLMALQFVPMHMSGTK